MSDFYSRVKDTIKKNGTTIRNMCTVLGINLSSYRTNHSRKYAPRLDDAIQIAKYLGVSLDFLATGDEFKNAPDYPHWHELDNQHREAITMIVAMRPHTERFDDLFFDIKSAYRRELRDQAQQQQL